MRPRLSVYASLAVTTAVVIGLAAAPALANSRFKVVNNTDSNIRVEIFNGDDKICAAEAKNKKVQSGHTQSYGCAGGGNHRCKIDLRVGKDLIFACKNSMWDACGNNRIAIKDGETITINPSTTTPPDDHSYPCTIE